MSDDSAIPAKLLKRLGHSAGRHLFVPSHFDFADNTAILEFIRQHPLAQLVSVQDGDICITATPLIYDDCVETADGVEHRFIGHIARRNRQAKAIRRGAEVAALIDGPNAYISPRWSVENPSLPTWSYLAVQLRGVFEPITRQAGARVVLARTIAQMERDAEQPWTLEDAADGVVETLIHHIVAFRLHVFDMQGVSRLNQNRTPADRRGIIDGLLHRGDSGATRIAQLMQANMQNGERE